MAGDMIVHEHWGGSGFANTDLDFQLKQHGIRQVILVGLLANTCIEATGRFAAELGLLYQAFDVDAGVGDLDATIQFTRQLDGITGGVGTVGYCLGGLLAFLTAVRTNAEAAVSYYGVGIDKHLGEAATFTTPLLMHIAEEDESCRRKRGRGSSRRCRTSQMSRYTRIPAACTPSRETRASTMSPTPPNAPMPGRFCSSRQCHSLRRNHAPSGGTGDGI